MSQSLVFDIETIPLDFDTSFDDSQKEYLLRGCNSEEEREERKGLGGLNPLLGKVINRAPLDPVSSVSIPDWLHMCELSILKTGILPW